MMAYCSSCGTFVTSGLLCSRCSDDMRVSRKDVCAMAPCGPLDLETIERMARKARTPVAGAFLLACHNARRDGSEYGWA